MRLIRLSVRVVHGLRGDDSITPPRRHFWTDAALHAPAVLNAQNQAIFVDRTCTASACIPVRILSLTVTSDSARCAAISRYDMQA